MCIVQSELDALPLAGLLGGERGRGKLTSGGFAAAASGISTSELCVFSVLPAIDAQVVDFDV